MLGILIIYPAWIAICLTAVVRPWIGIVGFYGCVILEPNWNWRWSIPEDFAFQKYIALATLIGFLLRGGRGTPLNRGAISAICALCGFLAIAYVSATQSIAPQATDFYMNNMWKIVLMAILAIRLIDTPKKVWIFLLTMAVMQGYSAFRINEQYFQDGICIYAYRPWGFKGDNNLYSNLTVPLIACSGAICVFATKRWQCLLAGFIFILQIHQLMLMESRGAMLATVGMLCIFAWFMPKNKFTIRASITALVLGAALAGPPVVKEFGSIFDKKEDRDSSAESRYKLWKAGWEITKDYPLLGVGPYAGQRLVAEYYEGGLTARNKGLHNLVFEISTGCGIPATILYFLFFLIPWWSCLREMLSIRQKAMEAPWLQASLLSVVAGIPGYLAASMFSSGALLESPYALASLGLSAICVSNSAGRFLDSRVQHDMLRQDSRQVTQNAVAAP